ncbi:MAG: hypothetical protein ABFD75_10270, partial [Smithella sp.]
DPLERIKRLDGKRGVQFNHRRHPGRSREISVFLLTFLIMDVPGIHTNPQKKFKENSLMHSSTCERSETAGP